MSPGFPLWFSQIVGLFQGATTCLAIVLSFLIVSVVSRPGWRHHLRWAVPAAAASVLVGISRLPLYRFFGFMGAIQVTVATNVMFVMLYVSATLASLYGVWMLWRTLSGLARFAVSPDPMAQYPPQPGVWPPAPVVRQD